MSSQYTFSYCCPDLLIFVTSWASKLLCSSKFLWISLNLPISEKEKKMNRYIVWTMSYASSLRVSKNTLELKAKDYTVPKLQCQGFKRFTVWMTFLDLFSFSLRSRGSLSAGTPIHPPALASRPPPTASGGSAWATSALPIRMRRPPLNRWST